ncbi:hypothetical protein LEN26_012664 [Aphanomyces euteiches]|nr:hypothetical protein LEN26_012664 [Aphanomyces euteiches]KAH9125841.1 hypothetical protein AeMF1_003618 [Aphanomyces euteiches]KAH9182147.1 hypothetical protein AeNC1_015877 [Aphanomyces euteiches]
MQEAPNRTGRNDQGVLLFTTDEIAASSKALGRRYTDYQNFAYDGQPRTDFTARATGRPAYDTCDSPILDYPDRGTYHDMGPTAPQFDYLAVILGAIIGAGIGVGLLYAHIGNEWQKLVALPGDLFVRALRCLVLPLVFTCMAVVVAETVATGRGAIIRIQTLLPYMGTAILSNIQGMIVAIVFKPYFAIQPSARIDNTAAPNPILNLTMQCANGLFVTSNSNGSMVCAAANATGASMFTFINATTSTPKPTDSLSIQLLSLIDQVIMIMQLVVPVNIIQSFVEGSLLSIVVFAVIFGVAVAKSVEGPSGENYVLNVLRQTRNIFVLLLNALLRVTPVAVMFLMAGAVVKFDSAEAHAARLVLPQITYYGAAFLIATATHTLIVLPLLLFICTKSNPFEFLRLLFPAYVFAFGCASSMASLPVAIVCIQRASVSRVVANVGLPFGTPINTNASGIYYPLAVVFLASVSGYESQLTPVFYVRLFFVSFLGCMGSAPLPNAALVYIVTSWKTCFPDIPLPNAFTWIIAADFVLDRISTVVNINGNAVATRILAERVDETFETKSTISSSS